MRKGLHCAWPEEPSYTVFTVMEVLEEGGISHGRKHVN